MGLFNNQRQDEGQDLYRKQLNQYDELVNRIVGGKGEFDDVGGLGDVAGKFGIKPLDVQGYRSEVSSAFAPAKRGLRTQQARDRSALASRLGSSATPEGSFAPLEARYTQAETDLGGRQAEAELGAFDKSRQQDFARGSFLANILGQKQGFGERRNEASLNAMDRRQGATGNYLDTLSDSSTFDDILSVLTEGADLAGSFIDLPGLLSPKKKAQPDRNTIVGGGGGI